MKKLIFFLVTLPIKFYRYFISPFYPANCRFVPSCSEYAEESLRRHGAFYGAVLTIKRIMRCNPWGGSGLDPVPDKRKS